MEGLIRPRSQTRVPGDITYIGRDCSLRDDENNQSLLVMQVDECNRESMRQQHVRLPIVGMLVAGLINLRQIDRKSQSRASPKKEVVGADRVRSRRQAFQERVVVHGQGSWLLGVGTERKKRLCTE